MTGVEFAGPPAFESLEHVHKLWHQFRNELIRACRPFERPAMYWEIDLGMTMWSEQQKRTLIELKLPLTPTERAILDREREATPAEANGAASKSG
jgi:hypothetical protein